VSVDTDKFHQLYTNLLSTPSSIPATQENITIRLFRNSNEVITEVEG